MTASIVTVRDPSALILTIRHQRVILDADLAQMYGVPTKAFNQAVRRNPDRFPSAFMFRLTPREAENLRSQIVTSSLHGGRRYTPCAFTEHGALMAANILNSPRAVRMSVAIIKAFVRLREEAISNEMLARRLAEIEKTVLSHDSALRDLYNKIRPLLLPPPEPPKRRIGFHAGND